MAQLKDSVVLGSLRVTDTLFGTTGQFTKLNIPTTSGGTTYGPGSNNQVLKSNGTTVYWASDSQGVTSVQVQATSPVLSSTATAQNSTLNTTISLADGYGDTKNPYGSKTKNYVLAASATANSAPSFRALVAADIPNLSASKITSDTFDAARIPTLSITDKTSGTLTVARGGTGVTSFTANSLIMSGSSTTAALTTRAITNNTSNTAITNSNTNIPTMNTIYYGLVGVNNASQSRATTIYAPTGAGTAGQYLKSSGGTSAPVWETFSKSTVGLGNVDNSTYAGGTAVTLNGTSKASSTASFYAPTAAGTAGQFLKSSGSAPTWDNITYPDIKPLTSKTYAPAASYGSSDANETCTFFFMSVKPETWYKPWQVRFKIRTVCDSYANVDSITWATLNGRADGFTYHNWNDRYDVGHYYTVIRPLKNAGFTAGLGHMVGISVRYATGRGNTAYTRKFYVDYYESENCEVTLLDNANLWANLGNTTSYSDTNYNGYNNMNAVDRGLQESGDANSTSISHWYEQYGGWVAGNNIKRYQFIFENADHKLVSVYGTDNDYGNVNKTLLTVDFDPLGRIFYYSSTGSNNTDTNIDPARLYNTVAADLRYSFNVASSATTGAFTGVRYTQLYLKTTMTASTGMVHVASNQPLVTTLPTSNDGYYYIYLGQVHSWYQLYLSAYHPVYYHNGTTLVRYYGKEIGGNAASATVAASANSVAWGNVSGKPLTLTAQTTGFKISGGTTSKTLTVGADYTLAAACAKGVTDNSSNADVTSSDTNLITGRTLYYQLAKKGYTTNTGTVTSVQVQASSPLQSSVNTAQSQTLSTTISFTNQTANTVLAGPSSGSAAAPAFRSLVAADIPNLNASKINDGTLGIARGGTNISSYAKGDILYASAANTLGKLTIGSSGQVLSVSSSGVPAWTTLPTATSSAVGMVKPGHGLTISSGTLNMSSNFTFDSSNVLTGIAMGNITCDITSSSWTWRDT